MQCPEILQRLVDQLNKPDETGIVQVFKTTHNDSKSFDEIDHAQAIDCAETIKNILDKVPAGYISGDDEIDDEYHGILAALEDLKGGLNMLRCLIDDYESNKDKRKSAYEAEKAYVESIR